MNLTYLKNRINLFKNEGKKMKKSAFLTNTSLSKNDIKKAVSKKTTQEFINLFKQIINDKYTQKEAISIVKALDGQKIRNTSDI